MSRPTAPAYKTLNWPSLPLKRCGHYCILFWAGSGKTIITTTHDLSTVDEIADHCLIFQQGQMVAQGAPRTILTDTTLLEQTNLIHAHRHSHDERGVHSHPHLHVGHAHPH